LRFIPHYVRFVRSGNALISRDFLPVDSASPRPLSRLLHRGPPSQLLADLQLAPKHVITRLAVSEEIIGIPDAPRCRSPRACILYASLTARGVRLPSRSYRSDVNRSPIAITDRSLSSSLCIPVSVLIPRSDFLAAIGREKRRHAALGKWTHCISGRRRVLLPRVSIRAMTCSSPNRGHVRRHVDTSIFGIQ